MEEKIMIDRYEPVIENGQIVIYAVKGKQRYKIPEAYKDMCNDNYLAITERSLAMPELYQLGDEPHYIPLRTVF